MLNHGQYIQGPEVFELEAELAAYTGRKHCVSCASGTDALLMSLLAQGIGVMELNYRLMKAVSQFALDLMRNIIYRITKLK